MAVIDYRLLGPLEAGIDGHAVEIGGQKQQVLLDGRNGAAIWCGHGVFAHNLIKIAALAS